MIYLCKAKLPEGSRGSQKDEPGHPSSKRETPSPVSRACEFKTVAGSCFSSPTSFCFGWMSGRVFYNTLAGDRSRKCVAKIPVVGHRPTHIAMDWGKCLLVYFQIFMVKSPITSHNCWSYIPMTSPHSPQSPNYIPLNLHYPMKFQFSIILSPKRCPYKPIYIW